MFIMTFAAAAAATLLAAAPLEPNHPGPAVDPFSAIAIAQPRTRPDSQDVVRQTMTVSFQRPVKIGDRILFGRYLIEHDNNRMARGRPCTYIYAADDPRLPVVAFHCTHLHRPVTSAPTVVLRPMNEANGLSEFLAFQFAGESEAHGVPMNR